MEMLAITYSQPNSPGRDDAVVEITGSPSAWRAAAAALTNANDPACDGDGFVEWIASKRSRFTLAASPEFAERLRAYGVLA